MSRRASPELWLKLKPIAREMRREPAPAEDALWKRLRNRQLNGLKFRRQHAIERFVVDIYCADIGLVVEVDGPVHQYTQEEDRTRQEFLESLGLAVLRLSNEEVQFCLAECLRRIAETAAELSDGVTPLHAVERGRG